MVYLYTAISHITWFTILLLLRGKIGREHAKARATGSRHKSISQMTRSEDLSILHLIPSISYHDFGPMVSHQLAVGSILNRPRVSRWQRTQEIGSDLWGIKFCLRKAGSFEFECKAERLHVHNGHNAVNK